MCSKRSAPPASGSMSPDCKRRRESRAQVRFVAPPGERIGRKLRPSTDAMPNKVASRRQVRRAFEDRDADTGRCVAQVAAWPPQLHHLRQVERMPFSLGGQLGHVLFEGTFAGGHAHVLANLVAVQPTQGSWMAVRRRRATMLPMRGRCTSASRKLPIMRARASATVVRRTRAARGNRSRRRAGLRGPAPAVRASPPPAPGSIPHP